MRNVTTTVRRRRSRSRSVATPNRAGATVCADSAPRARVPYECSDSATTRAMCDRQDDGLETSVIIPRAGGHGKAELIRRLDRLSARGPARVERRDPTVRRPQPARQVVLEPLDPGPRLQHLMGDVALGRAIVFGGRKPGGLNGNAAFRTRAIAIHAAVCTQDPRRRYDRGHCPPALPPGRDSRRFASDRRARRACRCRPICAWLSTRAAARPARPRSHGEWARMLNDAIGDLLPSALAVALSKLTVS